MSTKFNLYLYRRFPPPNSDGYTLLEILVVLGIVGILIAIAAPSLLAMQAGVNINNSLEKVRSTLELSQIETIKKKKNCTVAFTQDAVTSKPMITSGCLIGFESVDSSGNPVVKLDSGVTMTKIPNTWDGQVVYNNSGLTQSAGTIILGSSDTYVQKCLTISAGIGLLRTGTYSNGSCVISE
jgi:prepilin-type N-terminal cleavage/methylation domain-containing protein